MAVRHRGEVRALIGLTAGRVSQILDAYGSRSRVQALSGMRKLERRTRAASAKPAADVADRAAESPTPGTPGERKL